MRKLKFLYCIECLKKIPPEIKGSDYLIPVRKHHYGLMPDGFTIDRRVEGVCSSCLEKSNKFQQSNAEPVDLNHKDLVTNHR